jgi:DNA-binding response OmpR family regulator
LPRRYGIAPTLLLTVPDLLTYSGINGNAVGVCVMGSVSALRGRAVPIVEDESLIALDLAAIAAQGGHALVASTVDQALSALSRVKFAAAIIDHRLGREDATEVIRRLEKLKTPFIIHSGYDAVEALAKAPLVRKPAIRQHLIATVSDLLG